MIKKIFITSLILLLGSLTIHMFSSDFAGKLTSPDYSKIITKGESLYKKRGCISCHGAGGDEAVDETYPKLSGQPMKYLKQQIIDIRDGKRANGGSSIMKSSINGLTDEEAYLIAFYLSKE